jgi:DNA-binding NarL/FixJ family response regulator
MTHTVLIVDDHEQFRGRARNLLERAGYEVVGEAADGAEAIVASRRLAPEVVLLDIQLPGRDGFSVAEELGRAPRAPKIVLISTREASDYGRRLRNTVAIGFIHKPRLSPSALQELIGGGR